MQDFRRRAVRALLVVAAAASTTACATVTRGTKQSWTVQSDPGGAQVATSNGFSCDQTPCTFKMKRNAEFDVTVSKDGYKPYQGRVTHAVSGGGAAGMAGNVLVGGLIGVAVDAGSGAMMDLKPNPLVVQLEPEGSTMTSAQAPASE